MSRLPWSLLPKWLRPSRHDPDRKAGDLHRDLGEWAESASAYRRYLRRRSRHVAVWIRLGNVLKELGDFEGADQAYGRAAQLRPSSGQPWRGLGDLRAAMGDHEQASLHYARAWSIDRDASSGAVLAQPAQRAWLSRLEKADLPGWSFEGAVEGLRDLAVEGWALSLLRPDEPATLVLLADGKEAGRTRADLPRPDVAEYGLAPLHCGFQFNLGRLLANSAVDRLEIWHEEAQTFLPGSPIDLAEVRGLQRWLARPRRPAGVAAPPKISIITPVHDVRPDWFNELTESILAQDDGRWEWIVFDDGSQSRALQQALTALARRDSRIQVAGSSISLGTASATNEALRLAAADHVLFVDHDDILEPEAIGRLITGIEAGGDLIYGDEAVTGADIRDIHVVLARPAFSWRYYLSHPYFVHPVCIRNDLVSDGLNPGMPVSADVDLVLRVLERAARIVHVPGVIYRWRSHAESVGHRREGLVTASTIQALDGHFHRLGVRAKAHPGAVFNTFRIEFADPGGRVLIVIPTKNGSELVRTCIDSVLSTTTPGDIDIVVIDHESDEPELASYLQSVSNWVRVMKFSGPFNFSRMNNQAVEAFGVDHHYVLFLNNDVEALEPGWLERMRALAAMPDVGAVGATLLYPDGRVQHAGVVIGLGGYAEHAMKFSPFLGPTGRNPGYNCSLTAIRDWSAATAACLMMPLKVFRDVGGFDEALAVGFNDTDLCLRVRDRDLHVIVDGWAVLRHHESATRRSEGGVDHPADAAVFLDRWRRLIDEGDPFYNPMLSSRRDHHPDAHDTDRLTPRVVISRLPARAS